VADDSPDATNASATNIAATAACLGVWVFILALDGESEHAIMNPYRDTGDEQSLNRDAIYLNTLFRISRR
jgi:hypothetical protein